VRPQRSVDRIVRWNTMAETAGNVPCEKQQAREGANQRELGKISVPEERIHQSRHNILRTESLRTACKTATARSAAAALFSRAEAC
jgi:uncharacterized small protein (DUF1192 family)